MMWLADDTTPARVAPTRVYRWERDEESYAHDRGMVLRTDDTRAQDDAYAAQYWYDAALIEWNWMAHADGGLLIDEGECATEDAARRACEDAVLHAERES